jgi:hypothetical protein
LTDIEKYCDIIYRTQSIFMRYQYYDIAIIGGRPAEATLARPVGKL